MPDVYRGMRRIGLRITWHGHSCFEITDSKNLVVDPHDGVSLGLRKPDATADVVAITHDHFDHNKDYIVSTNGTMVIRGTRPLDIPGLSIKGFEAYHDMEKGKMRGKVVMYRFRVDGITCLHVGDLGHVIDEDIAEEIGKVDILFVPVGGNFTIDSKDAVRLLKLIDPLITIPMHYWKPGISLKIDGVAPFLRDASLPILRVGFAIDFVAEDLPNHKEIWLFDY